MVVTEKNTKTNFIRINWSA